MANPFDFLGAINAVEKPDLFRNGEMTREQAEKDYVPFIVTRGLSFYPDTILYANEVNQISHIEKIAQNDYFRLSIRARKRWSKWPKPEKSEDLDLIQEVYGYSREKAAQTFKLLSKNQLKQLREQQARGTGGTGK
jgi:DNA polymerase II small subunit/DNA polymerase delta subunit B